MGGSPNPIIRKKLASWVGFSNLPNQVHRRSVRCAALAVPELDVALKRTQQRLLITLRS